MIEKEIIRAQLGNVLTDATLPGLPNHYTGKVRDTYRLADGRLIIIATDRQSAFDINLAAVPFKGQVLTQTARYWFDATGDICANHVIEYPDPNVVVCRNLDMLPVEMVVRDYMTGSTNTSIWPMYEQGKRAMYGVTFPDGLVKNQKLQQTILTHGAVELAHQSLLDRGPASVHQQQVSGGSRRRPAGQVNHRANHLLRVHAAAQRQVGS